MLDLIKKVFQKYNIEYETIHTTVGEIARGEVGNFRGFYWIWPDVNFYFGIAASITANVTNRFKTHLMKLRVALAEMYGPLKEKKQPKKTYPINWIDGVLTFIIEAIEPFPEWYVKTDRGTVLPGQFDFKFKHKVDPDTLPVTVFKVSQDVPPQDIKDAETEIIELMEPYANDETYRKRQKIGKIA